MAQLTYNPLEFQVLSSTTLPPGTSANVIDAGQAIRFNASDRRWYLASASGNVDDAQDIHLASHGTGVGGVITPIRQGIVNFGASATGTAGLLYVLSGNPGLLWNEGDLTASMYVTYAGTYLTGNAFHFAPHSSGQLRG